MLEISLVTGIESNTSATIVTASAAKNTRIIRRNGESASHSIESRNGGSQITPKAHIH